LMVKTGMERADRGSPKMSLWEGPPRILNPNET